MQTDSSNFGLGATLYQEDESGEQLIIALASRMLRGPEKAYSTTLKEALGVVYALQKFRSYLIGRHFIIRTDHKALTFINKCHVNNEKLLRWVLWLQMFSFDIEYLKGTKNVLPDLLSRQPVDAGTRSGTARFQMCAVNKENERGKGRPQAAETREPGAALGLASAVAKYISGTMLDGGGTRRERNSNFVAAIKIDIEGMPRMNKKIMRELQGGDPVIALIRDFKEGKIKEDDVRYEGLAAKQNNFRLVDNMLYARAGKGDNDFKLWMPSSMREKLTRFVHTKYGHFGAKKIERMIKEICYWKNMGKEIRKLLARCSLCQFTKYPNRNFAGEMHNIIPSGKNKLFAADLYGPLPRAIRGNKHIFVILDVFSKFTQVYPITQPTAKNCIRCLKKFIDLCGTSERILTDNATIFTGREWEQAVTNLGMTPIYSSIRNPQSNPSERVMRELSRLFRTYCNQRHTSWIELIPHINRWLPSVFHESIGTTPFEAHFGKKQPRELSNLMSQDEKQIWKAKRDYTPMILENLKRMGEHRKKAAKGMKYRFEIGDLVLLRAPKPSDAKEKLFYKFFLLYEGPYTVQRIVEPNAAVIVNEQGEVKGRYNFRSLRPYKV